ncbi:MAG: hypothetical protein EZS28_009531, partial [Streblomastix strix]
MEVRIISVGSLQNIGMNTLLKKSRCEVDQTIFSEVEFIGIYDKEVDSDEKSIQLLNVLPQGL